MMIKTLIIDDEPKARETISEMLKLYCPNVQIIGEAEDVGSGYEKIIETKPQLILLDIQMPDGTGFDLLRKFENLNLKIVFITAFEEYAIKAFKYSAVDYLLKPVDPDELIETINKVEQSIISEGSKINLDILLENISAKADVSKKIVLKTAESIHIIKVSDIIRCEASSNYTKFYLIDGKKLLVSKTLKEFDEMLPSNNFFRPHQSHLVNINYIDRFEKSEGGFLIMKDNATVPVSYRKKEQLLKLFDKF